MGKYDDIIDLPRHVSRNHAPMPLIDRAAQFSPFAALTGYDAAVRETARYVAEKIELDEEQKRLIDAALHKAEGRGAVITHFVRDERKSGGAYVTTRGVVRKVDPGTETLVLDDMRIGFGDLYSLELEREDRPETDT